MESLSRIILCFKPSEYQHIRDYYKRKSNRFSTKRLQLFDIIKNKLVKDEVALCRLIYNHDPDGAFSQLKKRLKKDLLNFLILFNSANSRELNITTVDFECRKLYLQAKALISRGQTQEAIIILKNALNLSRKYDIIDLKIVVSDQLRSILQENTADYDVYTIDINKNIQLQSELLKAKTYNHSLRYQTRALDRKKIYKMGTLASLYSKTKSPNLGFWNYSTKMQDYWMQGNFKMSYLNGLRCLHLIETQPAVCSSVNKIFIKNSLARVLILLKNNNKALHYLVSALQLCGDDSYEQLIILESLFFLKLVNGEHENLEDIFKKAFGSALIQRGNSQWNKWIFYQSCQKFVIGEFESSLLLLRRCDNICKEKHGPFFEHRLVEILNLIELEEFDLLYYKVENFRKLIEYYDDVCTGRSRNFVKLIKALIRNNYDFNITSLKEKEIIDAIALDQYNLQIMEVIDINSWFRQKANLVSELV